MSKASMHRDINSILTDSKHCSSCLKSRRTVAIGCKVSKEA